MHSILAARTDFSLGESILTVKKLVSEAKAVNASAVAITDTMCITGMVEFTNLAIKEGVKPIIGARLRISDDPSWRPAKGEKKKNMPRETYLTVYALTEAGMKAIFRLLSLGNDEDHFYYHAKISLDDLYKELDLLGRRDLAVAFGDTHSTLAHPDSDAIIADVTSRIGTDYVFATLTPAHQPYWGKINALALAAISKHGLKPLVARPAFYEKGGSDAAEIMAAVCNGNKISDGYHKSPFSRDMHVMGLRELGDQAKLIIKHLGDRGITGVGPIFREGLENTVYLADAVSFQWSKAPVSLPTMAPDEFAAVKLECAKGWKDRFKGEVFGHRPTKQELDNVYLPRLKYELSVLQKLNFSGYFLLVQDVVQFAKNAGILVGPGRGSVGGSLVAYLMGITDCDPIRFGLLFERFINPDRIDLPDADLDFMSERRHEVFDYLVKKYGKERVAGVSNFSRLGAPSAIRDVGRVVGMTENDYRISKYVPKVHGQTVSLETAEKEVPEIAEFAHKFAPYWTIMQRLEGAMRNYGQHAAGVVVGGVDLVERGVVERRKEGAVINWDKRIVEDQGLVKMDILGLNTLDLLHLTCEYIRERHGKRPDLSRIPLDDPKVLEAFARADTNGIFQFDGSGMKKLLRELATGGTVTFDDITACTALYRPGPMESGMMESFYLRKQGHERIEYDHPLMEPILRPTFGVMVYQEQVMEVARVVAGYSAPDADKLRKIMGKKLPEEMAKERDKFVKGCVATVQADERWAGNLFDKIEGFAGYGFNKSHSVEYTLISYQAMYLKVNYPVEFQAASLTLMSEGKLSSLLRETKGAGIRISMPDLNLSTNRFEIVNDTEIVIPFLRIKGIGGNTVTAILEARKNGPFKDVADFLSRVEKRRCNIRHQEILRRVGAFARLDPSEPPADDPSRIVDQIELLPGLMTATVPVHHDMETGKDVQEDLGALIKEYITKHGPAGDKDGSPVKPLFNKQNRFMLIQDCPGNQEDQEGQMGWSQATSCVVEGMAKVGLDRPDVYWTALVKRVKSGKQIDAAEIKTYLPYLLREIELLKPPVIVLMGSGVVRHFLPDLSGKASDSAGQVFYNADMDANMVVGFNPGEVYFSPEKQELVDEIFQVVEGLLS